MEKSDNNKKKIKNIYALQITQKNNCRVKLYPNTKILNLYVSRCVCCHSSKVETLDNLLVQSDIARGLWDHFASKLSKNNRFRTITQLSEVWLHGVNRRSQLGMITLAILLYGMWEIWKIRCKMKFEGEGFDAHILLRRMYTHIYDISFQFQPKREPSTMDSISLEGLNCAVRKVGVKKGRWLYMLEQTSASCF